MAKKVTNISSGFQAETECTAMCFYKVVDDRQPNDGSTTCIARAGLIHAIEAGKEMHKKSTGILLQR